MSWPLSLFSSCMAPPALPLLTSFVSCAASLALLLLLASQSPIPLRTAAFTVFDILETCESEHSFAFMFLSAPSVGCRGLLLE